MLPNLHLAGRQVRARLVSSRPCFSGHPIMLDEKQGSRKYIPPNYISFTPSTKAFNLRLRLGWRSLRSALASIWRMRSRVT